MTVAQLENRLTALEKKVEQLQVQLAKSNNTIRPWSREYAGGFANDPLFDEMVRLGKEYRDSLKPSRRKRKR